MQSFSLFQTSVREPALALLALTLASTAVTAQQIPIPPFSNTFSAISGTRGFFFQAPVAFAITGLRVPDETLNGSQNVEVFVMSSRPPTFSTNATGGSVFYAANVPSTQIIATAIPVAAGQWVGVLGACGTTTMHNSYGGVNTFQSSVLGVPMTIERFITQTNLNSSGGNQPYSHEASGSLSRIEVYTTSGMNFASAVPFGMGCSATGGMPLTLAATSGTRPVIGTAYSMDLTEIAPGTPLTFLALGFARFDPPIQFPAPVRVGCFALVATSTAATGIPGGTTSHTFPLPIPAGFTNNGLKLYAQAVAFPPPGGPSGLVTSNGLDMTIDIN